MSPTKVMSRRVMVSALLSTLVHATTAHAQVPGQPIRIGVIASQTGPVSFIGDPIMKSVQLATDQVNQAGGIKGRQIQLIAYDDESSPDKALSFAKRLVTSDQVSLIIGPNLSSTVRAALPTIEAAGIPVIYNTPITEPPPKSLQFSVYPSEETSYRVALQALKERGVKTLGVLATTDTTGDSGFNWITKLAGSYGISVVASQRMDLQDKDVTPQLSAIKTANPDAVFSALSGAVVAVVCKGYVRLGIKKPLVFSTGAVTVNWPDLLKGITPDTLIFPTYKVLLGPEALPADDVNRKPLADYFVAYQQRYGKRPDMAGGGGYDTANLAFLALQRAGSSEPAAVRTALEQITDFVGVNGNLKFSPEQHRGAGLSAQVMAHFKDGRFMVLKGN
jgi:branched-chain amino acid transport system substrate-binding protein